MYMYVYNTLYTYVCIVQTDPVGTYLYINVRQNRSMTVKFDLRDINGLQLVVNSRP